MKLLISTYAVPVPVETTLTPAETQAWVGLLHAYSSLVKQLDAELTAAHGLTVSGFDLS